MQKHLEARSNNSNTSQTNHKNPRVSVIIPTYNTAKYLDEAIASVIEQTYTNYEIIVIDDGSTDETSDILKKYQDRIYSFYQENQGVSAARNKGISLAKGELIAFLDADDLFLPNKLAQQVAVFDQQPQLGIVNSGFRLIAENKDCIADIKKWETIPKLTIETWILHKPVLPSAMMFRKTWLEKVNGFDIRWTFSEDVDLVLRMIAKGCQGTWLTQITTLYRRHDHNATEKDYLTQVKHAEAIQDNFFACQDLPTSIAKLESQFRFNNFAWLAWLCYQGGHTQKMAKYLQKSQLYTSFSWTETIAKWIECFKNCTELYGDTFDAYSFAKLPEWQKIVSRMQISPLFNKYYPQINNYQKLLAEKPNKSQLSLYAKNYYYLGHSMLEQKDVEQAIILLNKAIEIDPNNPHYNNELGKAFEEKYDLEDAIASYKKVLRLEPSNEEFQQNLERVLKLHQQWQELTQYCQELSDPNSSFNQSPKLLMIFPYPPYIKARGGAAIRMFEQIKYFGKKYHLTVVSFIFDNADYALEKQLQPYCDRAIMVKLGTYMGLNTENQHRQVYNLKTWNMWKILQKLSQVDFDLVFFDFIFTTSYYPLFSDRINILHEHNIESKLLASCKETYDKELIADLAQEIGAIHPFINAESEYKKLEEYEIGMWPKFALRTVVSEADKYELERRCKQGKTIVVSNGINTQKIKLIKNKKSKKILYMGTMSYYPNIDAVLYFVEEILPLIQKQDQTISFCIAGCEPPRIIQNLEISHSNIEVIADPEDMSLVAKQCSMTVVPLRQGSGTRIKILHAMAMGLPIVSTSIGYEGLEMIDGVHLLVRDQPEDFAAAVLKIHQDQKLATKLRKNGRQLVEEKYDWQHIFTEYEQEILTEFPSLAV